MRKSKTLKILAVLLAGVTLVTSCKKESESPGIITDSKDKVIGYLYTTTNGEGTNQVIKLNRSAEGNLFGETAYSTNSNGGANTGAGGGAKGDFDSQNAIQIIGDYLLNVNAGGNTISVFSIDRPTGELTFKKNEDSKGVRPTSISYTLKSGSTDEYWVVVGNQWNNPNVQKDGDAIERYPNDAWHAMDLTAEDATDTDRNIILFSFSTSTGELTYNSILDNYVRENGGPATVTFNDDGTKLAVSTWGIAHFSTEVTSLEEQHASRVYVYDFNDGSVSGKRYFEEEGISGTIGLNWAKGSSTVLNASNFNLIPSKRDNSLTVLEDNGTAVTKTGYYNTAGVDDIDEACWTLLNPEGNKLYVASFGANTISSFDVNATGNVTSEANVANRSGNVPAGDTKDMYITPTNSTLFVLGAFQTFSIDRFNITASGLEYVENYVVDATSAYTGMAGTYNFLGLAGYDL